MVVQEEAEAAGGRRSKKKKGGLWKEWGEAYTTFDPDKDDTPYYYTRLGPKEPQVAIYPKEIQAELKKAAGESDTERVSKDIQYELKGWWLYKLRIFGGSEKAAWAEKLSGIRARDGKPDDTLVGAQWRIGEATAEPPEEFEEGVKYRPIFLTAAKSCGKVRA